MKSIYEIALGSDFCRLHPHIQRRFGLTSQGGIASIGMGIMAEVWHGPIYTLPFLYVGSWRRIMFPERGHNVPFMIENYAFVDSLGRESVTWIRTFDLSKRRRFDAYMIYSPKRGKIVDYMGSHEHLAVDLDISVDERGGLKIQSDAQRFYEGRLAFPFPLLFSGIADVCEWYDEASAKFCIDVNVHNRTWGPLFGYHGTFDVEWWSVAPNSLPADLRPMRVEGRE
ncbi:MAG TPA: DUF4166 domain-containing protein [Aggregatilineales bacterium]|nr:DUF4166 domain-containing protein [Aggregatilineales bacterium]